jgi:hypothetical protein
MKPSHCLCIASLFLLGGQITARAEPEASIRNPGPDMANFPNSAFTLPKNRAYAEIGGTYNSKKSDPEQYTLGYILRYGLTDDLELRLISDGLTITNTEEKKLTGISPQTFDIKYHLIDAPEDSLLPAVGIEALVQSTWSSPVYKGGTQGGFSVNFDHALPYDLALEYNVGFNGQQLESGDSQYQLALSWALQKNLTNDFAVFANGFTNTGAGLTSTSIGAGAQWIVNNSLALFVNTSSGLTVTTPSLFSLAGFAVAF